MEAKHPKGGSSAAGDDELAGWRWHQKDDGGERILVELSHESGARVEVEVSPPGQAPALVSTPEGDVSYTTFTGVTSRQAAELARAFAARLVSGEAQLEAAPPPPPEVAESAPASEPPPAGGGVELDAHAYALSASGFTVMRSLLGPRSVQALAELGDRAMKETLRQQALGVPIPENIFDRQVYAGARSLHIWGDAGLRLLENEKIRELAETVIGPHKLVDVVLFVSLPASDIKDTSSEGWHRDANPEFGADYSARYLWFILPIDDFVADNGATWLVPGSHRFAAPDSVLDAAAEGTHHYPNRVQMLLDAGDALVLDPATLHTRGHNITDRPRRMVNLMLSHESSSPRWQWDFAGKKLQDSASPRVRSLLGGSLSDEERNAFAASCPPTTKFERSHDARTAAWPALPPDWQD